MYKKLLLPVALVVVLFVASLFLGSVPVPTKSVLGALLGQGENSTWHYIIIYSRLPQALTALLAGGALSVSGLLLQTAFRNPLAAPDIFGVTGGASFAVALLMLAPGMASGSVAGDLSIVSAAFIGALTVTVLTWAFSQRVGSSTVLVIIGIMVGYLCSSGVTLLNAIATKDGVRSYVAWGMGSFAGVSMDDMPFFVPFVLFPTLATLFLMKPLNAMLLGANYAEGLGINVRHVRNAMLILTGLLTAVVTAFCGPVAFIALAVPHVARLVMRSSDHRSLLPATILMGSAVALFCNILTTVLHDGSILPLNAVTPLIGAPVIIYIILKKA